MKPSRAWSHLSDVVFADHTGKKPEGSVRWQVCKTRGRNELMNERFTAKAIRQFSHRNGIKSSRPILQAPQKT
jgi:hypothetical protein